MHSTIVLGIFILAMILLASGRVRIDLIGLIMILSLGLTGVMPSSQLFSGFSSEAVILIAGMLALGEGLVASGVTDWMARFLSRAGHGGEARMTTVLMTSSALPSGFISDVGLVGMFIPVVRQLQQKAKIPVQRLLMPLAVAATLGGLLTMVGSAGNIVGNEALKAAGDPAIGIFGITPIGFVLLIVGVVFMLSIGRFLMPRGTTDASPLSQGGKGLRQYVSELTVLADSPLVGRHLGDITVFSDKGVTVVRVIRDSNIHTARHNTALQAGDILMVLGDVDGILKAEDQKWGLALAGDVQAPSKKSESIEVGEILLGTRAPWVGRTVIALNLRRRLGLSLLGLYRDGHLVYQRLAHIRLRVGDILLLQGSAENFSALHNYRGLLLLDDPTPRVVSKPYGLWLAPTILLSVLLLAAINMISIEIAIVLGITLMVVTGILPLSDAYHAIEWRIVVFVAGMIPLGDALIRTGITEDMVHVLGHVSHALNSPDLVVALLFVLAAILTQILSNIATVLVLAPVGAELAKSLHLLPDPFVMAVILAVSSSPLTPLANKVDLLIMGPGGYKYGDFLRMGLPLTVIMGAVTTAAMPFFFPFH